MNTLPALVAMILAAQPAPDAALIERLTAIDAKAATIRDLTAEFEQKKHTALLKEPMVSSGRVRVKGSTIRWDTEKPRPSVIHIDEKEVRVYYPEDAALEIYTVDEQLRRLTGSPMPRLKPMQEQFDIAAMPTTQIEGAVADPSLLAIRLTPKAETLRKHVKEVHVLINPETGLTERLEMLDPEGDRTLIRFLKPRTNTGLDEKDLALKVPSETKISRPLEGRSPPAPGGGGGK
jgi:outer membrane lipoprotein-sorting protein